MNMSTTAEQEKLSIQIESFGPTAQQMEDIGRRILQHDSVRRSVGIGKHRLLNIELIDPTPDADKPDQPRVPELFRAAIHDYVSTRTFIAEGPINALERLTVSETAEQPNATAEEFQEAVEALRGNSAFAERLRNGQLVAYRPIPSLIEAQQPTGHTKRAVAVGLFSHEERTPIEILGVELGSNTLHRFDERAPPGSRPSNNSICGAPAGANQSTTSKGTAGQVWVTVTQGGTTLWRFLVVRPAASSGLRGSGVELRYVDYRGKRVLYRAHVPILNVRYDHDACGPYRDWQYQEGEIQAVGTDVAPGFRLCSSPAQTIMDTGSDVGNFLGVGIYVQGQEVVLVSEMEAGWYRYVSQWRLATNGTIRPRFGFAATDSPCVCNVHHHHAYWRLDFDIQTAGGNRVMEFNDPPIIAGKNWHEKHFEIARPRDPAHKRKWRVENIASGAAYEIVPTTEDGVATQQPDWPFGAGDVWVLRYHGNEIDDGFNSTTSANADAKIGEWVNGESVLGQDVVLWYGAHFTHDIAHQGPAGHVVGPDLVPERWLV
jgi:hypothetical protein